MSNITIRTGDNVLVSVVQPALRNQVEIFGLKGEGDKNYIHNQTLPSDVWVVSHNLGKKPSITVVDSADEVVFGEVQYNSDNQVTLTFAGAFSGKAYFN